MLQRSAISAIAADGEPNVRPLSARDVVHVATLGGGQAAHVDAAPRTHAYGAVLHMDTSNVEAVFVDGRVVNAGGRLVDVDVPAVADELAESADGLLRRSGARSILLFSCRAG